MTLDTHADVVISRKLYKNVTKCHKMIIRCTTVCMIVPNSLAFFIRYVTKRFILGAGIKEDAVRTDDHRFHLDGSSEKLGGDTRACVQHSLQQQQQ